MCYHYYYVTTYTTGPVENHGGVGGVRGVGGGWGGRGIICYIPGMFNRTPFTQTPFEILRNIFYVLYIYIYIYLYLLSYYS